MPTQYSVGDGENHRRTFRNDQLPPHRRVRGNISKKQWGRVIDAMNQQSDGWFKRHARHYFGRGQNYS